jgi:ubiquinone/menaquinone biosynthesis C-methylase UbiE
MAQYSTDINLAKRIAIHKYGVNPVTWSEWYFFHVTIKPGVSILDIGCGNGALWSGQVERIDGDIQVWLADNSAGMIETTRQTLKSMGKNWHFTIAAVEDLPFERSSFDMVMANHMLYHASNANTAIAEIARVLKPDGCLFTSTNGFGHMKQIQEWMQQVELPAASKLIVNAERFGLENGFEILRRKFKDVQLWRYEDVLSVPEVGPVLDYVASIQMPDTPEMNGKMKRLEIILNEELQRNGRIRIEKESGLFEARGPVR